MTALRLPLIILAAVAVNAGAATLAGLGAATVLEALTGLFCLLAAFGGPLRADLRLLAVFAPVLVIGAGVPRLLGAVAPWAAIALLAVVIFVAGLVPALGQRYVTVGLGLGMASVFGYGFALTGSATTGQVLGAPALAVGVALVIRLLLGARDPGGPTREAIADALTGAASVEPAGRQWLGDRPVRWLATALGATLRYRAAESVLADRGHDLTDTHAEAEAVADLVRARRTPEPAQSPPRPPSDRWRTVAQDALDTVRTAATSRDTTLVGDRGWLRRTVLGTELRGALTWRSAQLRHAVRTAVGMALVLALALLRPGDPMTVSLLMTTYSVMQPQWRDSWVRAAQRLLGAVAGAVVVLLLVWLAPPAVLVPVGLVALLGGLTVMRTAPVVFSGCMVLMSVAMNAARTQHSPVPVLLEYLLFLVVGAVIGLGFGFAVVPGVRRPTVAARFTAAVDALRALLDAAADGADRRTLGPLFRAAARARQDLVGPEPGDTVERAADALHGLYTGAVAVTLADATALAEPLRTVAAALPPAAEPDPAAWDAHRATLTGDDLLVLDALAADLAQLHHNVVGETVGAAH